MEHVFQDRIRGLYGNFGLYLHFHLGAVLKNPFEEDLENERYAQYDPNGPDDKERKPQSSLCISGFAESCSLRDKYVHPSVNSVAKCFVCIYYFDTRTCSITDTDSQHVKTTVVTLLSQEWALAISGPVFMSFRHEKRGFKRIMLHFLLFVNTKTISFDYTLIASNISMQQKKGCTELENGIKAYYLLSILSE